MMGGMSTLPPSSPRPERQVTDLWLQTLLSRGTLGEVSNGTIWGRWDVNSWVFWASLGFSAVWTRTGHQYVPERPGLSQRAGWLRELEGKELFSWASPHRWGAALG